jgi:hypothetical protein
LPQPGRPFYIFFGAWRKCLLRQALGARQAGAGGGPCHMRKDNLILLEFVAKKNLFPCDAFREVACRQVTCAYPAVPSFKSMRVPLPQQGSPLHIVSGVWRLCLLRQALGARQAGAGGGPCHQRNATLLPGKWLSHRSEVYSVTTCRFA